MQFPISHAREMGISHLAQRARWEIAISHKAPLGNVQLPYAKDPTVGCNRSDLPQKHECLNFRLCKACWKKQGSPFIEAGHTCGECEKPFWATRGILFRLGVCRPCFDRLRNQTLRDCYERLELEWGPTWQHNAVFLGNLDYQLVAKDVHGFVHNLLFDGRALNHYLFSVKCRRGGHWAHYWAQGGSVEVVLGQVGSKGSHEGPLWRLRLAQMVANLRSH